MRRGSVCMKLQKIFGLKPRLYDRKGAGAVFK